MLPPQICKLHSRFRRPSLKNHFPASKPLLERAVMESLAGDIRVRLDELFPKSPIPASPDGRQVMEIQDFFAKFQRIPWNHIEPCEIYNSFDALFNLDQRSFAYYLPAFISCVLRYVVHDSSNWLTPYVFLKQRLCRNPEEDTPILHPRPAPPDRGFSLANDYLRSGLSNGSRPPRPRERNVVDPRGTAPYMTIGNCPGSTAALPPRVLLPRDVNI